MVVIVKINDELNSLEMNSTALDFVQTLNNIHDDEIHVDFSDVIFISRSFAQGYWSSKIKLDKNILEINVPEDLQPLFDIMERNFKR